MNEKLLPGPPNTQKYGIVVLTDEDFFRKIAYLTFSLCECI